MTTRPGEGKAAPPQMDPSLLPDDDVWRWRCHLCPTVTQGGWQGLEAHTETIHPGHGTKGTPFEP